MNYTNYEKTAFNRTTTEKTEMMSHCGELYPRIIIVNGIVLTAVDDCIQQYEDAIKQKQEILEITREIQELNEIQNDLATMITAQGETIEIISEKVDKTEDIVEKGYNEIVLASEYKKKYDTKKLVILSVIGVASIPIIGIKLAVAVPFVVGGGFWLWNKN